MDFLDDQNMVYWSNLAGSDDLKPTTPMTSDRELAG
jgi:hypothetical protein